MECLSGMKGNFHVPFLEEGEQVIALPYSALRDGWTVHPRFLISNFEYLYNKWGTDKRYGKSSINFNDF